MKWAAVITFLLTAVFTGAYSFGFDWALSYAITFATFFYHFAMRLLVGHILHRAMQNKANYRKAWYQLRPFEIKLYQKLNVKKWEKNRLFQRLQLCNYFKTTLFLDK